MPTTPEDRTALALAALAEVTDPGDVGALLDAQEVEPGVVDLRFACALAGYAGWHWTVSTSDLANQEPTVLEVELLPGDGALLSPPWVPWAERLAEWRRQHPGGDAGADEDEADDDEADELDEDDDELDEDDPLDDVDEDLLDGVEIDAVDPEPADIPDGAQADSIAEEHRTRD